MAETAARKVALVTGAARGLGRAMALGLAKAGHVVAACDLPSSAAELQTLAGEALPNGALLHPLHCDVTDTDQCRAAVADVRKNFGAVDILVNDAAIGMEVVTPHIHDNPFKFYEIEESFWRRVLDINMLGTFRMTKLVAPQMVARGWGRVINITTSLTTMIKAGFSPYGPSKAAIESASAIWSKELAGTGVTVNVLIPGAPANTRMIPEEDVAARDQLVQPDAMVPPLLWLVSRDADRVTGRRYQAKLWSPDLPAEKAEQIAGANVAWG
ncbi:MAG TPA: SDR family oxidoreductase [Xanthobacteraceae bacterium]|nr:SDR family oxidoreductase [Xanthobacteraceae bacterium]